MAARVQKPRGCRIFLFERIIDAGQVDVIFWQTFNADIAFARIAANNYGITHLLSQVDDLIIGRFDAERLAPRGVKVNCFFFQLGLCPDFILECFVNSVQRVHTQSNDFERIFAVHESPSVNLGYDAQIPIVSGGIGEKDLTEVIDFVDHADETTQRFVFSLRLYYLFIHEDRRTRIGIRLVVIKCSKSSIDVDELGIIIRREILKGFAGRYKRDCRFLPTRKKCFDQPDAHDRIQIRPDVGDNGFHELSIPYIC